MLLLEPHHQVQDPDPDRDVEHARRLVREHDLRLDREGTSDRDPLPLAAGELVRVLRRDLVRRHEPDRPQQLVRAFLDLRGRHDPVDPQRALDVVADRLHRVERSEGVLEDDLHLRAVVEDVAPPADVRDVAPLEEHGAPARVVETREQARDRALSAPALADERRDRARAELEGDVLDGVYLRPAQGSPDREALREVTDLERAHSTPPSTRWHATRWSGSTSRNTGRSVVCRT